VAGIVKFFSILIFKIGEISLMKEMTTRADVMMTDEERAEMEAAGIRPSGSTSAGPTSTATAPDAVPGSPPKRPMSPTNGGRAASPPSASSGLEVSTSTPERRQSPSASGTITPNPEAGASAAATSGKDKKGRPKMTPEQKAKLKELDEERRKATEARCVLSYTGADIV
jgi:hypothetical protein